MSSSFPAANAAIPNVSPAISARADRYREEFVEAQPFKHLAMEDFFEAAFAERLLQEFPHFDSTLARNEIGEIGGKAVNTRIREISPAYRELYDTIGGKPFLELMSRISGIPDLILDPRMYGGGTHENLHGQELDPHVDFNYDEAQQLHRRLNVIVYLNKGWQTEWGGAIEIHSNPRDPEKNKIRAFDPVFNRCVMFETNEISWHGFPKIDLPPDVRHISRKSISIYLYTTTRPAAEIAPLHGTFYVQRPLPERFREGTTLTAKDVTELKELLWRRDIWIQQYQKMELDKNREIDGKNRDIRTMMANYDALTADSKAAIGAMEDERFRMEQEHQREREAASAALEEERRNARLPVTGYAMQSELISGVSGDLWMARRAEVEIRPRAGLTGLRLQGWRPEGAPAATLRMRVDESAVEKRVQSGIFALDLPLPRVYRGAFRLQMECDALPAGSDPRELAFRVMELRAMHPMWELIKGSRQDLETHKIKQFPCRVPKDDQDIEGKVNIVKPRVAVVGAGSFGRNHLRVIDQSEQAELAGVLEVDPQRAEAAVAIHNCPTFSSLEELAGQADAAVVATPTVSHSEIGCRLMELGLDVLIEKPIADTVDAARKLVDTAARCGRILQVGHLERFNPAVIALGKALGTPLFFEIHRLSEFSPRSLDVDVVLDLMIHDIDIVLSLTGQLPDEIRAAGIRILSAKVDIANVRLQFPSGCVANLTASRVSTERVRKLRLFQPHEYISLDYSRREAVRFRVKPPMAIDFSPLPSVKDEPLKLELDNFFESIATRQAPVVTGEQGLAALEVARAILDRIEEHAILVASTLEAAEKAV